MNETTHRGPIIAGEAIWGHVHVGYARQWVRHRLVIYPPGTNAEQRRWLRVWRWLPGVALLALSAGAYGASASGLHAAIGVSVGAVVTIAAIVALRHHTAPSRQGIRMLEAWTGPGQQLEDVVARRVICTIAGELRIADTELAAGRITHVDHELVWGRCYAEISEMNQSLRIGV